MPASSTNLRNFALKKEELLINDIYKKYLDAFSENFFIGVSNFTKDGYDSASALACNLARKNNISVVAIMMFFS